MLTAGGTARLSSVTVTYTTSGGGGGGESSTTEEYKADAESSESTLSYSGTSFSFTNSDAKIFTDKSSATANDNSGKTFAKAFMTSKATSTTNSNLYILTAKKALTKVVVYYTVSDSHFTDWNSQSSYSKSGNLQYQIGSGDVKSGTVSSDKNNAVAYAETIEPTGGIASGTTISLYSSANRLAIFSVVATYEEEESTGTKVYLSPTSNWTTNNPWFAVYYYKSSNSDENGWIAMTATESCAPIYTAEVPSDYDKMIFCRMNPSKSISDKWDGKWTQTGNLDVPTTTSNCYTISASDGTGSWGTYTIPTYTITFDDNTTDEVSGTVDNITGKACGASVTLPTSGYTRSNYTFLGWNTDASATTAVDNSITVSGNQTYYAVWQAEDKWFIKGYFGDDDNWATKHYITEGSTTINLPTAATNYTFKIVHQEGSTETWWGLNGSTSYMTKSSCSNWQLNVSGNDGKNCGITSTCAGDYIFYVTTTGSNPVVSVTYPTAALTVSSNSLAFGTAALNATTSKTFTLSGVNLTADATLAISGTNAAMFSVEPASVAQSNSVIAETTITVKYTPTAAGSHSATLTVSSDGATSKEITLTGTGQDVGTIVSTSGKTTTWDFTKVTADMVGTLTGWTSGGSNKYYYSNPEYSAATYLTPSWCSGIVVGANQKSNADKCRIGYKKDDNADASGINFQGNAGSIKVTIPTGANTLVVYNSTENAIATNNSGVSFTYSSSDGTYTATVSEGAEIEIHVGSSKGNITKIVTSYVSPTTTWSLYSNISGSWAEDELTDNTTVTKTLSKGVQYQFKLVSLTSGVNTYYGAQNATNEYKTSDEDWTLTSPGNDIYLTAGANGTYTFTRSESEGTQHVKVTYPTAYMVSYESGNDAATGSMAANTNIASGESQKVSANGFTYTGYHFMGWKADVAVTTAEKNYAVGDLIPAEVTLTNITSNITLTAQWETAVTEVTLSAENDATQLFAGYTLQLSAAYTPSDAAYGKSISKWESINTNTATVDGGLVTGVSAGTVTITATSLGGVTATYNLTIKAAACGDQVWTETYWANGSSDKYQRCFTQVGSTTEWRTDVFALPSTADWFAIGQNGGANTYSKDWTYNGLTTIGLQSNSSATKYYPGQDALGYMRIFSDYTDENYYVAFEPTYQALYGVSGSGDAWTTLDFTATGVSHTYETELFVAPNYSSNANMKYYIGTKRSGSTSPFITDKSSEDALSGVTGMKDAGWDGKYGKFQMYDDNGTANWGCVFIPYYAYTLKNDDETDFQAVQAVAKSAGGTTTFPTDVPTKMGYTCTGWTRTKGSSTVDMAIGASYTYWSGNDVFYPVWTPITYTVKFDANGGTGTAMADQAFTYDVKQKLTKNTYTRTNYSFTGWATTSSGAREFVDEQEVQNITTTANDVVTLYAVWVENVCSTPSITASSLAAANYNVGDAATPLSVTASAAGTDETRTYQWYSNTTASNEGGTLISGATSASYTPATTAAGTTYYYCVVSNTRENYTTKSVTSAVSGAIVVSEVQYATSVDFVGYIDESDATLNDAAIKALFTDHNITISQTASGVSLDAGQSSESYVFRGLKIKNNGTNLKFAVAANQTVTFRMGYVTSSNIAVTTDKSVTYNESSTKSQTLTGITEKGSSVSPNYVDYAFTTSQVTTFTIKTSDANTAVIKAIYVGSVPAQKTTPTVEWNAPSTVYAGGKYSFTVTTNSDATLAATQMSSTGTASMNATPGTKSMTVEFTMASDASAAPTFTWAIPEGTNYSAKTSSPDAISLGDCSGGGTATVWDFTTKDKQTAAGTITASSTNTLMATDGSTTLTYVAGSSDSYDSSNGYIKPNGKSSTGDSKYSNRYFKIPISSNGVLTIVQPNAEGKYGKLVALVGTSSTTLATSSFSSMSYSSTTASLTVSDYAVNSKDYIYVAWTDAANYISSITWTPSGSGSKQTPTLAWSEDVASGKTVTASATPFTVTATATSIGTVSYALSNVTGTITINESTGAVTATTAGSATVTATVAAAGCFNSASASYELTVNAAAVAVTGVSLNKTSTSIEVGKTETLTATIAPEDATNKNVTWSSSDATNKITVSDAGVVSVADDATVGSTATITVTTTDGNFTATCEVTVTAASEDCGVLISGTLSYSNGWSTVATGDYAGSLAVNAQTTALSGGYKLGSPKQYVELKLADGKTLKSGDIVRVNIVGTNGSTSVLPSQLDIYVNEDTTQLAGQKTTGIAAGVNEITLGSIAEGATSVSLYRTCRAGSKMNPYVISMAVYRECSSCTSTTLEIQAESSSLTLSGDNVTTTLSKKSGSNTSDVTYAVYTTSECTTVATGASVSGSTFTATAAGTYYVKGSQVADGTYCATTSDAIAITVSEASTEITINYVNQTTNEGNGYKVRYPTDKTPSVYNDASHGSKTINNVYYAGTKDIVYTISVPSGKKVTKVVLHLCRNNDAAKSQNVTFNGGTAESVSLAGRGATTPTSITKNNLHITGSFTFKVDYGTAFELVLTTEDTEETLYTVSCADATNGTVATDAAAGGVAEGTTVTVTPTPATNYELDELYYVDANSKQTAITTKSGSNYTFLMPNSNVTVYATFKLTLTGISVVTPPTKTTYLHTKSAHSYFDPAGLVIRETYSDNSTVDITYNDETKSGFTFNPSLTTDLTSSNSNVSITYAGKSTTQDITVNEDVYLTQVKLSNGFNTAIVEYPATGNHTIDGYYLSSGQTAATIDVSTIEVSSNATYVVDATNKTITVTSKTASTVTKTYTYTITAVDPLTDMTEQTITAATPDWLKLGKWSSSDNSHELFKSVNGTAVGETQRIIVGVNRVYLFVGPCATLTLNCTNSNYSTKSGTYSINGGAATSIELTKASAVTIPVNSSSNSMIELVNTSTSGSWGFSSVQLAKKETTVEWKDVPTTVYNGGKYTFTVTTDYDGELSTSDIAVTNATNLSTAINDKTYTVSFEPTTTAPTITLTLPGTATMKGGTFSPEGEITVGDCSSVNPETNLSWGNGLESGGTVYKSLLSQKFTIPAVSTNSKGKVTYALSFTKSYENNPASIDTETGEVTLVKTCSDGTVTATIAASGCYPEKSITYNLDVDCEGTELVLTAKSSSLLLNHGVANTTITKTGDNVADVTYSIYSDEGLGTKATGASIQDGIFTATATGTYYITAKQEGDGNYCATSTESAISITVSLPKYTVYVVDEATDCSVTYENVEVGKTVTVTHSCTVDGKDFLGFITNPTVEITVDEAANTYTFTMPESDVTLTADWANEGCMNKVMMWKKATLYDGTATTDYSYEYTPASNHSAYFSLSFDNASGTVDADAAKEKQNSSLTTGKIAGNGFTFTPITDATKGIAGTFSDVRFTAKIQDETCQYSTDGSTWNTLKSTNTSGDAQYEITMSEASQFSIRNAGTAGATVGGVWIRNMELQVCGEDDVTDECPVPTILSQTTDQTSVPMSTNDLVLTVKADDDDTENPYSYQWYATNSDGAPMYPITGATSNTYTIAKADQGLGIYFYMCKVTTKCNTDRYSYCDPIAVEFVPADFTVKYTLGCDKDNAYTALTSSQTSTSGFITPSAVGTEGLDISSISENKGKNGILSPKIPMTTSWETDQYVKVGFTIADGKKMTINDINVNVQPVSCNDMSFKAVLFQNGTQVLASDIKQYPMGGQSAHINWTFSSTQVFTGSMELRVYAVDHGSDVTVGSETYTHLTTSGTTPTYRLGKTVTISGVVTSEKVDPKMSWDDGTADKGSVTKTYGDARFALKANSLSDGALTYESSNTAAATIVTEVEDNTTYYYVLVHPTGGETQTTTIKAVQPETDNYKAASITYELTVEPLHIGMSKRWSTFYTDRKFVMPSALRGYIVYERDAQYHVARVKKFDGGDVVPAETPLLIWTSEAITGATTYNAEVTDAEPTITIKETNLLHGMLKAGTTPTVAGTKYYYKLTTKNGANLGWYWGNSEGKEFEIKNDNRCYLTLTEGQYAAMRLAPTDLILPDEDNPGVQTDLDEQSATDQVEKFFYKDKLYIRRNGQLYDAAGRLISNGNMTNILK